MKRILTLIILCMTLSVSVFADAASDRARRNAITAGNELYRAKNYSGALSKYQQALKADPSSLTAQFNQALAMSQIANALPEAKAEEKAKMLEEASKLFEGVAKHTSDSPSLASRANYNLGNLKYQSQDYPGAITNYKQALRLNPNDDKARRNLRIAQLHLPKQDQNKDQNKDKDQDKKQDPNKDKNKDQDKNQDQQPPQQQPQQPKNIDQQTADRLLQRSADKENQTRRKAAYGSPSNRSKRW